MKSIKRFIVVTLMMVCLVILGKPVVEADAPLVNLVRGSQTVYHYNTSTPVTIPETYTESDTEFRAVWVATVHQLNMPKHTSETQYKQAFVDLINRVKAKNMNAILFQVRPNNDAFYDSDFAPWSKWLTGIEGADPGWDVMQYMVDYAHQQGIEFHAWLNPYRVQNSSLTKEQMLSTLHNENFAKQNPDLVIAGNKDGSNVYPYILNPGEPEVKAYIRNVVEELITDYDVDGIHFDDYFYPYGGLTSDTETFNLYKESPTQVLADWRRENVNDVIRGVMEDIVSHNELNDRDVRFGVSPFGIWRSQGEGSNTSTGTSQSYSSQYADSRRWVLEGWVHYICPQIYWSFQHSTAPYADLVDWWASVVRGTDVDLVIGHGIHNVDSWLSDEIETQLRYNQKHPEVKGSAFYSASFLTKPQINAVAQTRWTEKPLNVWPESSIEAPTVILTGTKDGSVYRSNVTATITSEHQIYVKINNGEWILYENPITYSTKGTHTLHVKAVTDTELESTVSGYSFVIDKVNADQPVITLTGPKIGSSYITGVELSLSSDGNPIWVAINHGNVGEWTLYTSPIVLDGTGNYFIRTKTINSEDVESDEVSQLITLVNNCYPAAEVDVLGTGNYPYFQEATVDINGQTTVLYRINGGEWLTFNDTLSFTTEGTYIIDYKNNDSCGVVRSETVHIDKTAPSDPILQVTGTLEGKFYIDRTTVDLTEAAANDTIKYRLHNGTSWTSWQNFTDEIILRSTGNYTLEYYSIDQAGNASEVVNVLVRLLIAPSETNEFVERNGDYVTYYNTNTPVGLPTSYQEKDEEVRAVWVATVGNIDIGLHTSEAEYKQDILDILDRVKKLNFNTIFFQVRPMNDAFYPSEYAPFSRYLTGAEGVDPGWDVLEFIIEEGHKRGIEIHAWLNPYRVSNVSGDKQTQLDSLHEDNFARKNPNFVLQDSGGKLILNPGEIQVRNYIKNVIQELITNYDIDGVHFDDYFYSYSGMSNSQDETTYNETKYTNQTLADWRRSNVNMLVRDIFYIVENHNVSEDKTVMFGISPFGIWKSGGVDGSHTSTSTMQSFSDQYADTKKWVEEGWLHYILPQLYWPFDHSLAPYADLVDWWAELCAENGVDLIIGHGFYRYQDAGGWTDESEFLEQLRYNQKYDIIKGSTLFSYKTLNGTSTLVKNALSRLTEHYWTDYVTFPWESDVAPEDPVVNPPTCEINETWDGDSCEPNPVDPIEPEDPVTPEEPVEPETPEEPVISQTVKTVAIVGGSITGLGIVIFLVRKFVLKI